MAIRKFRIAGVVTSRAASAKITINGSVVFDGALILNTDPYQYIAEGEVDINDSVPTSATVKVEALGGEFAVGMVSWNYGVVPNPALTEQELVYLDTPFDEIPTDIRDSIRTKGGKYVRLDTDFSMGDDPAECRENRSNIRVNGNPVTVAPGVHVGVMLADILEFDTTVFSR